MYFTDDVYNIERVLLGSGIFLTPTDTVWSLCVNALDKKGIWALRDIAQPTHNNPYIVMVPDLDWLKHFVADIHPRIETLLTMHNKPVSIRYPRTKSLPEDLLESDGSAYIRIVHDPMLASIMRHIERPLLSAPACHPGSNPPINYNDIDQDILKAADYISQHRRNDATLQLESVIASYNSKGELHFIRE